METINDNSTKNSNASYRIIKVIILISLFIAPLVYLFVVTSTPETSSEQPTTNQSTNTDISLLENEAKKNPSFDNLINLSMAYINNKLPEKSIPFLQKAIEINPNSAIAYNNLGVAYILLQHYPLGISACNKALELDPTFQLAKNNLQWGMDEQNKTLQTLSGFENTPNANRDANFYINYGMVYYKTGNYDKSIEMWNKVFETDAKNTTALNNIGSALMMKNQIDDAILLFKRVLELDAENQLAKNNLVWALETKKNK